MRTLKACSRCSCLEVRRNTSSRPAGRDMSCVFDGAPFASQCLHMQLLLGGNKSHLGASEKIEGETCPGSRGATAHWGGGPRSSTGCATQQPPYSYPLADPIAALLPSVCLLCFLLREMPNGRLGAHICPPTPAERLEGRWELGEERVFE